MLDTFEILTTSGVVLWSKSYAPVGAHIINGFINDVFIEEKVRPEAATANGVSPVFKKEKYSLKWKRVKEFNLIFVVRLLVSRLHGFISARVKCLIRDFTGRLSILTSPRMDR